MREVDKVNFEQMIDFIKNTVNDEIDSRLKNLPVFYYGKTTEKSNEKWKVLLMHEDLETDFLINKSDQTLNVGDNVRVSAIGGKISNAYIDLKYNN